MTKMQIWSKKTPRRPLRKKPKKKVGLFEAPRQLSLHPRLFFSFSWTRTHHPDLPFLFPFSLSHPCRYPFLVLTYPTLACLPGAFTATWFEPDLPLQCWDPPDICLACSLKFPCRCVNVMVLFLSTGLIELRNRHISHKRFLSANSDRKQIFFYDFSSKKCNRKIIKSNISECFFIILEDLN